MLDILIPSCLPPDALKVIEQHREIRANTKMPYRIISSNQKGSASFNRNLCLRRCRTDIAIMLDDDIRSFYPGWETDLIGPLKDDRHAMIVSARLMRPDGRVGQTCSRCYELEPATIEIQPAELCVMPTAAIAFRVAGILFDEEFRGSGFEDGDWCFQYRKRFPDCRFIQSNRCRLVHFNEMKGQRENWDHNLAYFRSKWCVAEAPT